MIPYIGAAVVGLWLGRKGRPTSKVVKRECIGPKSGIVYSVDDMPQSGLLVVHGPHAVGTFRKNKRKPGHAFLGGKGHPQAIRTMIGDFSGVG